ncbi:MAG: aquaporin [Phycisphaerae bacterium]|nr:MAG: aquaporin [Phycisphaerae bacterium]
MGKYITEFVGTLFLVLIVGCAVAFAGALAPLAIGVGLMALVYMGGHISGAHYNPAVTVGLLLCRKVSPRDGALYILVQLLGGLAGAYLASILTASTFAPAPGKDVATPAVILAEALFTFMLVLVVLNVATVKKVEGNSYYGLAIGLTVTAGAFAVGSISDAAFNPAVGTGPTVIHALLGTGSFTHLWLYLVGPILGAGVAAGVFKVQNS